MTMSLVGVWALGEFTPLAPWPTALQSDQSMLTFTPSVFHCCLKIRVGSAGSLRSTKMGNQNYRQRQCICVNSGLYRCSLLAEMAKHHELYDIKYQKWPAGACWPATEWIGHTYAPLGIQVRASFARRVGDGRTRNLSRVDVHGDMSKIEKVHQLFDYELELRCNGMQPETKEGFLSFLAVI